MTDPVTRLTPIPDLSRMLEAGWPFAWLGDQHRGRPGDCRDDRDRSGAATLEATRNE